MVENLHQITSSNLGVSEAPLLLQVQERLFYLQKEKSELTCASIKFSVKIMGKLVETLEGKSEEVQLDFKTALQVLKHFLKVARICSEKASEEYAEAFDNEKKLFEMMKVYSDKCQSKLYQISQDMLNNLNVLTSISNIKPSKPNIPTNFKSPLTTQKESKNSSNISKLSLKQEELDQPKCFSDMDMKLLQKSKDPLELYTTDTNSLNLSMEE